MRSEVKPDPVPPPKEWKMRNPWRKKKRLSRRRKRMKKRKKRLSRKRKAEDK